MPLRTFTLRGEPGQAAFDPTGQRFAIVRDGYGVELYDRKTRVAMRSPGGDFAWSRGFMALSAGRLFTRSDQYHPPRLWDLTTGQLTASIAMSYDSTFMWSTVSPSGRWFSHRDDSADLRILDRRTNKDSAAIQLTHTPLRLVRFAQDDR